MAHFARARSRVLPIPALLLPFLLPATASAILLALSYRFLAARRRRSQRPPRRF